MREDGRCWYLTILVKKQRYKLADNLNDLTRLQIEASIMIEQAWAEYNEKHRPK